MLDEAEEKTKETNERRELKGEVRREGEAREERRMRR